MKVVTTRLHGVEQELELRMWSKRTRDAVERKYGLPGQIWGGSVLGALSASRGPNMDLMRSLFKEEGEKLNKNGAAFDIEKVAAIAWVRFPEPHQLTADQVSDLPDDEFERLHQLVHEFIDHWDDKVQDLKAQLAEIVQPSEREAVLRIVDATFSGEATRKN